MARKNKNSILKMWSFLFLRPWMRTPESNCQLLGINLSSKRLMVHEHMRCTGWVTSIIFNITGNLLCIVYYKVENFCALHISLSSPTSMNLKPSNRRFATIHLEICDQSGEYNVIEFKLKWWSKQDGKWFNRKPHIKHASFLLLCIYGRSSTFQKGMRRNINNESQLIGICPPEAVNIPLNFENYQPKSWWRTNAPSSRWNSSLPAEKHEHMSKTYGTE